MKASLLAILAILPFVTPHAKANEQVLRPTREESIQSFRLVFELEIPHPKMFESMEGRRRITKVIEAVLPGFDKANFVGVCVNTGVGLLQKHRHDGARYPVKAVVPGLSWATLIWEDENHWKVILDAQWIDFIPMTKDGNKGPPVQMLQPRDTGKSM